jgi:hypothetical protein
VGMTVSLNKDPFIIFNNFFMIFTKMRTGIVRVPTEISAIPTIVCDICTGFVITHRFRALFVRSPFRVNGTHSSNLWNLL